VDISDPVLFQSFRYEYPEKSVQLYFFRCGVRAGAATAIGCDDVRWVTPAELSMYEFPPADLPLVRTLQNHG
jgi:8-oxo-dGTP diphosphatase